ncbi:unnamed protein product [Diplocarpon coronariae]
MLVGIKRGNLFAPASIHAFEFDDEAVTLVKTKTIQADNSHAWIAFDHSKKNVYGASIGAKSIASYSVLDEGNLRLDGRVDAAGECLNKTSAFVLPSSHEPHIVYSGSWPGPNICGMAISVLANGTLANVTQSWPYVNESGVHGLAFGPDEKLLYSADLNADKLWTHAVAEDGTVSLAANLDMPKTDMHPRHLTAHPARKYLHVLMEKQNTLAQFTLDEAGLPIEIVDSYSLIPEGKNSSGFWSAEVALSASNGILWASARAILNATYPGYLNGFALDAEGKITEPLFRVETTTVGGGNTNQISPSPFTDEWMAMADNPAGYVQIWRVVDTTDGSGKTATPVAKVDIGDGGCCANTIWYD